MAKKRTRKRSSGRKVQRVYVSNPRRRKTTTRRRRYRRNPETNFLMVLLAAVGGSILSGKLLQKIPVQNAAVKNAAAIAIGVGLNMLRQTKKSNIAKGVGLGMAVKGTTNLLTSYVPTLAGENEMTADEQAMVINALRNIETDPAELISPNTALLGNEVMWDDLEQQGPGFAGPVSSFAGPVSSFAGMFAGMEDMNQVSI